MPAASEQRDARQGGLPPAAHVQVHRPAPRCPHLAGRSDEGSNREAPTCRQHVPQHVCQAAPAAAGQLVAPGKVGGRIRAQQRRQGQRDRRQRIKGQARQHGGRPRDLLEMAVSREPLTEGGTRLALQPALMQPRPGDGSPCHVNCKTPRYAVSTAACKTAAGAHRRRVGAGGAHARSQLSRCHQHLFASWIRRAADRRQWSANRWTATSEELWTGNYSRVPARRHYPQGSQWSCGDGPTQAAKAPLTQRARFQGSRLPASEVRCSSNSTL